MALQAGRLFGNYHVVRLIGEGAFGEVYLAENPIIERRAAIKVLRPLLALDTELVRRFFNEARAASAIQHPNIIEVFDAGETSEGAPYILMEFLEGTSLKKRLAKVGRFSVEQTLEIAGQAGSALAATHARGIVHRDLKPENFFLVPDASTPGGERVKILDFGIAKVKRSLGAAGSFRTETGLIMGSPTYMSPEQCKDSGDVDLRADIYSFATILYEMLAGKPPHEAATGVELLLLHLTELPRPLRKLVPELPVHMQDAIMRALQQERSERFEDVPAFLGALRGQSGGLTKTLPGETAPATGIGSGSNVEQSVAVPATSTFSQANIQVASDSGSQPHVTARALRRRLGLAFGGLVVIGLVLLLLFRRDHQTLPPVARGAMVAPPAVIGFVRQTPPEPIAPAVVAGGVDGGAKPSMMAAAQPVEDANRAAAAKSPARQHPATEQSHLRMAKRSPLTRKHRPDAPATQQDQEDVAGF
jgi:serine/threonine protein kinase